METVLVQMLALGLGVGVALGLVVGWLVHEVSGCGQRRAVGYKELS